MACYAWLGACVAAAAVAVVAAAACVRASNSSVGSIEWFNEDIYPHLRDGTGGGAPGQFACAISPHGVRAWRGETHRGVFCSNSSVVTHVVFHDDASMSGTLPSALFSDSLVMVQLVNTQLRGTLPTEMALATSLLALRIRSNPLVSGTIPTELGLLPPLADLMLDSLDLVGTIPSELGACTITRFFFLSDNRLTGTLPSELGLLTRVKQMLLYGNRLSGQIPSTLGEATDLVVLKLYDNLFGGTLPSELGRLTLLDDFDLQFNRYISGTIPSELGLLTRISNDFKLYANQLSGTIPTQLFALAQLGDDFDLSANQLEGTLPTEVRGLARVAHFDVSSNLLSGVIPTEVGAMTTLQSLQLHTNAFSGTLPSQLAALTALHSLVVYQNALRGAVPGALAPTAACHLVLLGSPAEANSFDCPLPASVSAVCAANAPDIVRACSGTPMPVLPADGPLTVQVSPQDVREPSPKAFAVALPNGTADDELSMCFVEWNRSGYASQRIELYDAADRGAGMLPSVVLQLANQYQSPPPAQQCITARGRAAVVLVARVDTTFISLRTANFTFTFLAQPRRHVTTTAAAGAGTSLSTGTGGASTARTQLEADADSAPSSAPSSSAEDGFWLSVGIGAVLGGALCVCAFVIVVIIVRHNLRGEHQVRRPAFVAAQSAAPAAAAPSSTSAAATTAQPDQYASLQTSAVTDSTRTYEVAPLGSPTDASDYDVLPTSLPGSSMGSVPTGSDSYQQAPRGVGGSVGGGHYELAPLGVDGVGGSGGHYENSPLGVDE